MKQRADIICNSVSGPFGPSKHLHLTSDIPVHSNIIWTFQGIIVIIDTITFLIFHHRVPVYRVACPHIPFHFSFSVAHSSLIFQTVMSLLTISFHLNSYDNQTCHIVHCSTSHLQQHRHVRQSTTDGWQCCSGGDSILSQPAASGHLDIQWRQAS